MTGLCELHAHTSYCDGANTCEEMTLAAIDAGLESFGISEHSHTTVPQDTGNLTAESLPLYRAEMRALREKYAGKITLLAGIELDLLGDTPTDGFDYVIGSTHFVCAGGEYRFVDDDSKGQLETAQRLFGGDFYAFAEAYYTEESTVARVTGCDIIGHFDLIAKNNEDDCFFDSSHPRYRAAAIDAMTEILKTQRLFEVNTGAMFRRGRSEQYPQTWLLRELLARGGEVILSGDAHTTAAIAYKFREMEELLRSVGFRHRKILTADGFRDIAL
ncbi:MAG: histidinol-phosphatase HisJ family protein [Oscillospiraceae bacterium]|jgi:histidinol-phosphatase (PHP family)|nr:histidinol-phosphatase HisJ family protein [Oscillospiraceae bacterium]